MTQYYDETPALDPSRQVDPIMREPQVESATGLCRSTRWKLERDGKFPKRVNLTEKAVGWRTSDIRRWINERAGRAA